MTELAAVPELPAIVPPPLAPLLFKLDLGCGPNKQAGFIGVDRLPFDGKVDIVLDLTARDVNEPILHTNGQVVTRPGTGGFKKWPWADCSVSEVHSSHFLEHLEAMERVHFVNELYRVLVPDGKATIIVPHWASCRAYGDMTHKWPPVSEFWFYYLNKEWRAGNAPHNDFYRCHFEASWGYGVHPLIQVKSQEAQGFAFQFYKEAIQDLCATLIKR